LAGQSLITRRSATSWPSIAVTIEAGRDVTYSALRRYISGEDAVREVTIAKLATQRAAFEVIDTCLQIHGGVGYMAEYDIERAARDARWGRSGAAPTRS
jgi:acyl-CoA dehydrogenase